MEEILINQSINNVIEKLHIYMQRNGQTMHGLANDLEFDYQPFYRLMTKKSMPTIASLTQIAQKLSCTLAELVSDKVPLDVPSYSDIDSFILNKREDVIRVFLPPKIFQSKLKEEFVAIKIEIIKENLTYNNIMFSNNSSIYQLFIKTVLIDLDGFFLVRYKNTITILEVLNVSSTKITAKYKNKTLQIPVSEIEVFLKFIGYVELPSMAQLTFYGKKL